MKAAAATSALEKRIDELEHQVDSLRRELDLSRRLLRAASQINSSLSLSQVVTRTLDNVQHSVNARRVALFLLEKSTEELLIVGARGLQQNTIHQLRYSEGEGIVGEAFRDRQLRIITNASENADWLKGLEGGSDGKDSWLVLAPLVADDMALGVLCVEGSDDQHAPNEEAVFFLETVASYAAAAIRNARLHEDLTARTAQLATLYEIGSALTSVLNLDRVLNLIVDSVTRLIGAEICSIMLLDATRRYLRIRVAKGLPREIIERTVIQVGDGISGWVAEHGQPLLIKDIEKHPLFRKKSDSKYTTSSLLSVPLKVRGEVIGVLNVNNKVPRGVFTEDDANLLTLFATQAAIAIENAHLYEEVERLATTDGLTGLYEHRYFQEALENELRRGLRYKHPTSLMMIDIDHFKQLNDTYGHQVGDDVLRRLAEVLRSEAREHDIVARYGGEEFALLLPVTPKEGALAAAARLRHAVEVTPFRARQETIHITVSIGIATCPSDATTRDTLIDKADQALYAAKRRGRNRVCYFDQQGNIQVLEA